MNDRDDYPEDPYRGRSGHERGYDYDPLSDPSPPQPPPRGRRARPGPADWNDAPGAGEFRRGAPDAGGFRPPAEGPAAPPRRVGAADALRGGRAARSGTSRSETPRPQGPEGPSPTPPPAPPRRAAGDPTQDALAALANLGGSAAPSRPVEDAPQPPAGTEEPPRRGRRTRPEPTPGPEPEPRGRSRGEERAPTGRRGGGRRRRGAPDDVPTESAPPAQPPPPSADEQPQEPQGRRARRKRSRREEEDTGGFLADAPEDSGFFDSGNFPGLNSSAATGAFAAVGDPPDRRPRRARADRADRAEEVPADSGAFRDTGAPSPEEAPETAAFAADASEEAPEPSGRRARRGRAAEKEPRSRRGGGRRRRGAPVEEVPQEPEAPYEETPHEEAPEPSGRRARRGRAAEKEPRSRRGGGRRRRGAPVEEVPQEPEAPYEETPHEEAPETAAFAADAADASEEAPEPSGRRARRGRAAENEEEPRARRGSRRRRGRREEPEVPEEAPEEDEYDYEEPALADIAAAYGGGRSSRRKAKELKRARANAGRGGRKRRRGGGRGMMILLALALILVIAGGGYGIMSVYVFPDDFEGQGSGEVVFVIEEGQAGATIASNLVGKGVVASESAFLNALEAVPEEERGDGLVPGTYSLAEGMSGEAAVTALLDPASRLGGRVTIREGLRPEEIIGELAEGTGLTEEELNEAYARTDELGLPDYATEGPAGYLFPDTYRFDPNMDALSVLKTMVTRYHQVAEEVDLENKASALDYGPNEIMAIASIIQAETGNKEDMPLISAVVHNRLAEGWPLEMDSTCFYELGTHGLALTEEQKTACKNAPGEYGTYGRVGLPVGPFVAPGKSAIEAALAPADVDYMFFALVNPETGETGFSTTLDEHNAMVAENQDEW
ncbi:MULTISPECIES: endolytic transglycosylase MltG [Nocardiopsis]|nr:MULTISPECIES: endolytic transglycosylase MltG [Nocardiopsis]